MSKNRPVMGLEWAIQNLIINRCIKFDFQQNTTDFSSFLANIFGTVTSTFHQFFGKRTLWLQEYIAATTTIKRRSTRWVEEITFANVSKVALKTQTKDQKEIFWISIFVNLYEKLKFFAPFRNSEISPICFIIFCLINFWLKTADEPTLCLFA